MLLSVPSELNSLGTRLDRHTPTIVIGGHENALSVARNLTRQGIPVYALNYRDEAIRFSRYARYVDGCDTPEDWKRFLLDSRSDHLRGSVLLTCSDDAILMVAGNYRELSMKFLTEEGDPAVRAALLDKFTTYRLAQEAGIPTVEYWQVHSRDELESLIPKWKFPLVLKPLYSPNSKLLKSKARIIADRQAVREHFESARRLGVGVLLMDYIPGGDERLCSYHTYLDENGDPLVHLTKRQPRRYPRNSGTQTYAVITWVPEAAELGLRFLRNLGLKGLAHMEFKWDERDRKLKIIEVNPRFSGSDCLITKSGINLALIAYNRLTGRPQAPVLRYKQELVLWRPIEDAIAAWGLHERGELRLLEWLAQVVRTDKFPFFEWRDPLPALFVLGQRARKALSVLAPTAMPRALRKVRMGS